MAGRVRFGFTIDFRNPRQWFRPWADFYAEYLDFVNFAEGLGFEQVWLPEHHGVEEDGYPSSPFTLAAAIAGRTKTIRIGTAVALAPFYHPVRLAEDTAMIDIVSNGRLEIAMGIGYVQAEADAYGFDFKTRARRSDEVLTILRKLWAGEEVTWSSEFFDLKKARIFPLPIQRPGIPLFVGGLSAPGFRRAATLGDGYCGPLEYYSGYLDALRAAGKPDEAARISLVSAYDMWTFVAEDPDKAFEEIAPYAYYYSSTYAKWQKGTDWGLKEMDLEAFKQSGMVQIFTPDAAIAHLKQRIALAPIESFGLKVPTGMPFDKFAPYVELFAQKVLPAFR